MEFVEVLPCTTIREARRGDRRDAWSALRTDPDGMLRFRIRGATCLGKSFPGEL